MSFCDCTMVPDNRWSRGYRYDIHDVCGGGRRPTHAGKVGAAGAPGTGLLHRRAHLPLASLRTTLSGRAAEICRLEHVGPGPGCPWGDERVGGAPAQRRGGLLPAGPPAGVAILAAPPSHQARARLPERRSGLDGGAEVPVIHRHRDRLELGDHGPGNRHRVVWLGLHRAHPPPRLHLRAGSSRETGWARLLLRHRRPCVELA
mmetsp:Transcript_18090/g.40848  ORF Transcript_18090/g.40848 Transcript_18090/m.40848 type:complete len:203 (+) Transcript_18090:193-801(+)